MKCFKDSCELQDKEVQQKEAPPTSEVLAAPTPSTIGEWKSSVDKKRSELQMTIDAGKAAEAELAKLPTV